MAAEPPLTRGCGFWHAVRVQRNILTSGSSELGSSRVQPTTTAEPLLPTKHVNRQP